MNRTFALAATLAAGVAMAPIAADAATVYVGPAFTGGGESTDTRVEPLEVGDSLTWTHAAIPLGTTFTDKLGVEIAGPGVVAAGTKIEFEPFFSIDNFLISLYEGTIRTPGALLASDGPVPSGEFQGAVSIGNLNPGDYFVEVSGTGAGTTGANNYTGSITVVPVPAALPLMLTALAGLGLIGRRKMKAAA